MLNPSLFEPYPNGRSRPRRQSEPVATTTVALMKALMTEGASLHTIAAALNREGLVTGAGLRWTGASVARTLRDHA